MVAWRGRCTLAAPWEQGAGEPTFARIMLYELMDFAHRRYYMVPGYQYVDDLVQRCEGTVRPITACLP